MASFPEDKTAPIIEFIVQGMLEKQASLPYLGIILGP